MEDHEREKTPKTPEELAEIAYLDKLRTCEGEEMPVGLPLACVVKVVAYEEVPKASEQYAMATVEGWDGQTWRLCIRRYYLEEGMRALFVSHDALLPENDVGYRGSALAVQLMRENGWDDFAPIQLRRVVAALSIHAQRKA